MPTDTGHGHRPKDLESLIPPVSDIKAEEVNGSGSDTARAAAAVSSPKIICFDGDLFPRGATRRVETIDPTTSGRVVKVKKLDMIVGLVVSRVSGHGRMKNTDAPFVTLSGQYAPGKLLRVTFSDQFYEPVRALLKQNVNSDEMQTLKNPIKVTCVGEPMKGFGMLGEELYLHDLTDPKAPARAIIGPAHSQVGQVEDPFL